MWELPLSDHVTVQSSQEPFLGRRMFLKSVIPHPLLLLFRSHCAAWGRDTWANPAWSSWSTGSSTDTLSCPEPWGADDPQHRILQWGQLGQVPPYRTAQPPLDIHSLLWTLHTPLCFSLNSQSCNSSWSTAHFWHGAVSQTNPITQTLPVTLVSNDLQDKNHPAKYSSFEGFIVSYLFSFSLTFLPIRELLIVANWY